MTNFYSTLTNSAQLSRTKFVNRHKLLGESFALPNMSWALISSFIEFVYLELLNSTRKSLGVSLSVEQKSEVAHD
jgi:hypothetical protein